MSDPQTTIEKVESDPRYDKSFVDFIKWFNRWLAEPINDREVILLGEAISYLSDHKVQRWRNPDDKASTETWKEKSERMRERHGKRT